ncbi:hypothetical protein ELY21_10260 [Legionella sp. km535]|nr:hypothetical protein ELY21_10260 [Legionella sp. km535]
MCPCRMNNQWIGIFLVMLTLILLVLFYIFTTPIPQLNSYHHFADTRTLLRIPNFWNVTSNVFFIFVSILGFRSLNQQWNNKKIQGKEAVVYLIMFTGVFLIGVGSAYYHWSPTNERLVWDRIPMTIVFMSLLSLMIMKKINFNWGFRLLIPLLLFGIYSVLYWHWTEELGRGDLRLYILVQFYTLFLLVFILLWSPKSPPETKAFTGLLVFYLLAKITEHYDLFIYQINGQISGHTLKHLFAAVSVYFVINILNSSSQGTSNNP